MTFFSSWILEHADGQVSALDPDVSLSDCDYKERRNIRPIALFTLGGEEFLVAEIRHWEGDDYGVFRVSAEGVMPETSTWIH